MRHAHLLSVCAALLLPPSLTLIAGPVSAQSKPPSTPKQEVADTYFGTIIADPYRWMEQATASNPEFRRWVESQNTYTRQVLDRLPQRGALLKRLAELADVVTTVQQVTLADERWFYLKLQPGQQTPKLYVRET